MLSSLYLYESTLRFLFSLFISLQRGVSSFLLIYFSSIVVFHFPLYISPECLLSVSFLWFLFLRPFFSLNGVFPLFVKGVFPLSMAYFIIQAGISAFEWRISSFNGVFPLCTVYFLFQQCISSFICIFLLLIAYFLFLFTAYFLFQRRVSSFNGVFPLSTACFSFNVALVFSFYINFNPFFFFLT